MGIYKDISIYCDECHKENTDAASMSVAQTRKVAKSMGWKRLTNEKGNWIDVCPDCLDIYEDK
jgi:hypothetical protein